MNYDNKEREGRVCVGVWMRGTGGTWRRTEKRRGWSEHQENGSVSSKRHTPHYPQHPHLHHHQHPPQGRDNPHTVLRYVWDSARPVEEGGGSRGREGGCVELPWVSICKSGIKIQIPLQWSLSSIANGVKRHYGCTLDPRHYQEKNSPLFTDQLELPLKLPLELVCEGVCDRLSVFHTKTADERSDSSGPAWKFLSVGSDRSSCQNHHSLIYYIPWLFEAKVWSRFIGLIFSIPIVYLRTLK